nr:MAG TPA: hypothetical protein [Caudoviricetes sp.]
MGNQQRSLKRNVQRLSRKRVEIFLIKIFRKGGFIF